MHKELRKLGIKKQPNLKTGTNKTEETQMAKKHLKKSLANREMQIKTAYTSQNGQDQ